MLGMITIDIVAKKNSNTFWIEVFNILANYKHKVEICEDGIPSEPLWYNSLILINKKNIYYKSWNLLGITNVHV